MAPQTRPAALSQDFSESLERQALASERLRVTILSGAFLLASAWAYFSSYVPFLKLPLSAAGGPESNAQELVAAFFAAVAAYEWGVGRIFARQLRLGLRFPVPALYGNAFGEISLCTLGLFLVSRVTGGLALESPMAWFYFLFIALSSLRLRFSLCLWTGFWACVQYAGLSFFLRSEGWAPGLATQNAFGQALYVDRALVLLLAGAATGFVSREIRRRMETAMASVLEQDRVRSMFGRHVSPEVVDRLLTLQGEAVEEQEVCILFLDVRGFTRMSEAMEPRQVVDYLNSLFEPLINEVNHRRGIINKFLGDGFMAVFGAPLSEGNDCENALAAALAMLSLVEEMSATGRIAPTKVGMGLHYGPVVTGTVGGPGRKEYTVIGDTVNLAARVEAQNKVFGSRILVTAAVYEKAGHLVTDRAEDLGPVQVPGRSEPVRLWRVA
ncbi:MAG: adenylate/guanylate cyclase domain-containing protein [Pseudomonadota bacterium]